MRLAVLRCDFIVCRLDIASNPENVLLCETTGDEGHWHSLSRYAKRDIKVALRKLFDLHYTAVHAVPHPKNNVFPATLVRIVRKLTGRALDKIVQLLEANSILPNFPRWTFMAKILRRCAFTCTFIFSPIAST